MDASAAAVAPHSVLSSLFIRMDTKRLSDLQMNGPIVGSKAEGALDDPLVTDRISTSSGTSRNSIMKKSTQLFFGLKATDSERKAAIIAKRGAFKWLPVVNGMTDMVHGAWWFVWGSVLCALIPVFPLISLYEGFWPDASNEDGEDILPLTEHVVAYSLLIVAGLFYTYGSWLFVRVFRHPQPPPVFPFKGRYFQSDELMGSWMFFVGTLPFIPVTGLYLYYNGGVFYFAFVVMVVFCVIFGIFIIATAPLPEAHQDEQGIVYPISIVAPAFRCLLCIPVTSAWHRHIETDWLLVCWVSTWGCLLVTIASFVVMAYESYHHSDRGIFDYSTGAVDMLFFLIGSMYWTAGSYIDDSLRPDHKKLGDSPIVIPRQGQREVVV